MMPESAARSAAEIEHLDVLLANMHFADPQIGSHRILHCGRLTLCSLYTTLPKPEQAEFLSRRRGQRPRAAGIDLEIKRPAAIDINSQGNHLRYDQI